MAKFVCVGVYNDKLRAEMAEGVLGANGIKAIVSGGDPYISHIEFPTGVRLLVDEKDKQKALDILASNVNGSKNDN